MSPPRKLTTAVAALVVCVASSQCSGGSPTTPITPSPSIPTPINFPNPNTPRPFAPQVFAGAGDIALCHQGNAAGVARLLDTVGGRIFTLGDHAYMNGTAREFNDCYHPTWGRFKDRTFPTPGNHEYGSAGAGPYFDYFGPNAGPGRLGYYSFDPELGGPWHIISLNSETSTGPDSPQGMWLKDDLAANPAKCILAYWHKPRWSSGPNGDHPHMEYFWNLLYEARAELILTGHDHLYERFHPQDPLGRFDRLQGIRQFIVGTGGVPIYPFRNAKINSAVRIGAHGILKLTLMADSYEWEFVPVSGSTLESDRGFASCH